MYICYFEGAAGIGATLESALIELEEVIQDPAVQDIQFYELGKELKVKQKLEIVG